MNVYVVIDTNVLVSAMLTHNLQAATIKVADAVVNGKIVPLYNDEILAEYNEVMHRGKFGFSEEDISRMIETVTLFGEMASRVLSDDEVKDPKDVVFYEVALSKKDAYLVTGNIRHFPRKPIVVTPAELVEILNL